jgi:hypothetical protein
LRDNAAVLISSNGSAMTAPARWLTAVFLASAVAGCGGSPPQGRYHRGTAWIEFRSNSTVVHGELGDSARVEFDKDDPAAVTLVSGAMRTTGRIVDSTAVEFDQGSSALSDAFEGRWVAAAPDPTPGLSADGARDAAAPLVGGWGAPGQPAYLEFRPDGTFAWGQGIGGTYEMLAADRVRLNLVQNGTAVGRLDHQVSVDGSNITLTDPDGAVTTYQRVR